MINIDELRPVIEALGGVQVSQHALEAPDIRVEAVPNNLRLSDETQRAVVELLNLMGVRHKLSGFYGDVIIDPNQ